MQSTSALGLALALSAASVATADVPGAGELIAADAPQELYLEVEVNGRPTGVIARFTREPDGTLSADLSELEAAGIAADPALAGEDGRVDLNQVEGLTYDYDEAGQRLSISADLDDLATKTFRLRARSTVPELSEPIWSAFANYNLFASVGRDHEQGLMDFDGASVAADAHISGPFGVLSSGAIGGFLGAREEELVRLNTTYTYSEVERLLTFRAGDTISGGLSWTRPVRLGGVQVERDFSLRPDLVTRPLPTFRGTAEVPSTLEVYSNNVEVFSGEVEPGPFELTDIPAITDAGAAQVVLVDAQGRRVVAHLPFFTGPDMLRQGMGSFSVEAGWPRRSFGVSSLDYASDVFGSATGRYGVTDRLTVEGHAEVGKDLVNAGAGGTFSFGSTLLVSAHAGASESDMGTGFQAGGAVQVDLGPARLAGRSIRRSDGFWDIAAASASRSEDDDDRLSVAPASAIDQLSLSTTLGFDPARLSLNYTHQERADDSTTSTGSVSLSRRLWRGMSLHVSGFKDLEESSNFGAFASISFPLGQGRHGQTGVTGSPEGATAFADVHSTVAQAPGETGWRVRTAAGEEQRVAAEAVHWTEIGRMAAAVDFDPDRVRAEADLDGSVVIGGGGIYFARRIHDSFAIADAGAEDVEVFYQNRPVGRTGSDGRLVVPDLRGYERNRISIAPLDLPVDVTVETDARQVVPRSGVAVYVDFGAVRPESAAIVVLVDASGNPLPVGSEIILPGEDAPVLIGYGGEAYLTNLNEHERLEVRVSGGTRCSAALDYQPSSAIQHRIEGVVCK